MANTKQQAAVKTPSGSAMYHYEGVVPPAQMMKEYAAINPELPERLVKMAEDEATHRRNTDKDLIKKSWYNEILKNVAGLISVLIICYTGYHFMINGFGEAGASIIKTVVVALSAVFVIKQFITSKK